MIEIEDLKASLDSNTNLTNDIKENVMELLTIFKNKFPLVELSNANERLKTVKIIKGSKFLIRGSSCYNPVSNEILLSTSKLDNVDCKHILMRELLNLITAKDNYTGFNKDNAYEAINIGYTEILTNFLVGNEQDSEYENEIVEANLLGKILGDDIMYNAYFTNNPEIMLSVENAVN